jgi:hypothetical protein
VVGQVVGWTGSVYQDRLFMRILKHLLADRGDSQPLIYMGFLRLIIVFNHKDNHIDKSVPHYFALVW